ncbi:MAG: tRNA pseudouridine(55) synthase TruB [Planctomycetaceae bacterium]|nr:tRNA pseudouridine(55) synthase TruB [Planctomycetaceae bacterium]
MGETLGQGTGWSGILNLAKPVGITSRDAVDVVQKLARPSKVGHAGTLDPLATGVLVVCIGAGTRMVPFIQDQRKEYRASFRLGQTSDSEDVTGVITSVCDCVTVTETQLSETLAGFVGRIAQVPPRVSAVRVDGRRAYALARKGAEFELAAKTVEVDAIRLLDFTGVEFTVELVCSGGTYVRSIGRDVGERLGCGALMTALERTAVGPYRVNAAVPLDRVAPDSLRGLCLPLSTAIPGLRRVEIAEVDVAGIRCGRSVQGWDRTELTDGEDVALVDPAGAFVGVAKWVAAERRLQPCIVFPDAQG